MATCYTLKTPLHYSSTPKKKIGIQQKFIILQAPSTSAQIFCFGISVSCAHFLFMFMFFICLLLLLLFFTSIAENLTKRCEWVSPVKTAFCAQ